MKKREDLWGGYRVGDVEDAGGRGRSADKDVKVLGPLSNAQILSHLSSLFCFALCFYHYFVLFFVCRGTLKRLLQSLSLPSFLPPV
jgi:hypothetical protein